MPIRTNMQAPVSQRFCKDIILPTEENLTHVSKMMNPDLAAHELRHLQAVYVKGKRWPQGSTIVIEFLGGTTTQKNLVEKVVMETYQPLVNLKLKFAKRGTVSRSDIRVTFDPHGGSWSHLGTDCLKVPQDRPTLNLAWLDDPPLTTDACCHGVIKHEFGHAIAAWIHEHQNPSPTNKLSANWNKPVIYKALSGPPNDWSTETIFVNMFQLYDRNLVRGSTWDPHSIMEYFFPPSWTLNNMGVPGNQTLSATDKQWLRKEYPQPSAATSITSTTTTSELGSSEQQLQPIVMTTPLDGPIFDPITIILLVGVILIALALIVIVIVVVIMQRRSPKEISMSSLSV